MKSRSGVFFINFDVLHLFLLLTLNGGKCFIGFKLLLNDYIKNKMLSLLPAKICIATQIWNTSLKSYFLAVPLSTFDPSGFH